jgi:hypothetical protein
MSSTEKVSFRYMVWILSRSDSFGGSGSHHHVTVCHCQYVNGRGQGSGHTVDQPGPAFIVNKSINCPTAPKRFPGTLSDMALHAVNLITNDSAAISAMPRIAASCRSLAVKSKALYIKGFALYTCTT